MSESILDAGNFSLWQIYLGRFCEAAYEVKHNTNRLKMVKTLKNHLNPSEKTTHSLKQVLQNRS